MSDIDSQPRPSIAKPTQRFIDDESERLRVLTSYEAEGLQDDAELAAIVDFAAKLCDVPASLVSLVDDANQQFLARLGVEQGGTPRSMSFCAHAMNGSEIMEIADATRDPRFADNPLVTGDMHVRYYAGRPLVSGEGAPLGALCVIDTKPRTEGLSEFQQQGMEVLAQAAMRRLEARREGLIAERAVAEREERMRQMIEGLPQIAWSASRDGSFDFFNSRWEKVTGGSPPRDAMDWKPSVHPDDYDKVVAKWEESFAQGADFEAEFRLRHADGSFVWMLAQAIPMGGGDGVAPRWFGSMTDIDEVYKLSESRDMMARELAHRIKNLFAVVTGLISLQARQEPEHKDFAARVVEVLRSLSRAHEFVRPTGGTTRESLQGLLEVLFEPYRDGSGTPRIRATGATTSISAAAATPLALVFHELATNSAKYGALSTDSGYVTLEVRERGDDVVLDWREHGGPAPLSESERTPGFGSRMVEMAVTGQLQGQWERVFEESGMRAELVLPKQAIAP